MHSHHNSGSELRLPHRMPKAKMILICLCTLFSDACDCTTIAEVLISKIDIHHQRFHIQIECSTSTCSEACGALLSGPGSQAAAQGLEEAEEDGGVDAVAERTRPNAPEKRAVPPLRHHCTRC